MGMESPFTHWPQRVGKPAFINEPKDFRPRLFSIIPNPVRCSNCELCVVGYNAIMATSAWMRST
jgi:hypothetical protein